MKQEKETKQYIYIYFDDSGVLHPNSDGRYFVYAGYVFLSRKSKDRALAAYRRAEEELRGSLKRDETAELKACHLKGKHKRFLNSVMAEYRSVACVIRKQQVYGRILFNKRATHRFKDYCLKRAVKEVIHRMIEEGRLDPRRRTALHVYIDNQPTTSDGFYTLEEGIREELAHGVRNFDYAVFHPALFLGELEVTVTFCDSKVNPLIRAADILANSYYTKYNFRWEQEIATKEGVVVELP